MGKKKLSKNVVFSPHVQFGNPRWVFFSLNDGGGGCVGREGPIIKTAECGKRPEEKKKMGKRNKEGGDPILWVPNDQKSSLVDFRDGQTDRQSEPH